MRLFPFIDWVKHADTTISGPGGTLEPARMPASNVADQRLSQHARILSNAPFYGYFEFDFAQARTVDGLGAAHVRGGSLAASLQAEARVIVTDDAPFILTSQPSALNLTNYSGSLSDIQDDPDSPDGNWLTWSSGTAFADVRFGLGFDDELAEQSLLRFAIASTDGSDRDFRVEIYNDFTPTGTIFNRSTSATTGTGGEVFEILIDPVVVSPGEFSIIVRDQSDSSGSVVLGAVELLRHKLTFANGYDSGWVEMFPSSLAAEADILRFSTRWAHALPATQSRRYAKLWIKNHSGSRLDVGVVKTGQAFAPWKTMQLAGTSWGSQDSTRVERARSGEEYPTEGIRRDVHRYNLGFLTREEVHQLRTYFDRVKGIGETFFLIPDETSPEYFFDEVIYGRMKSLTPANMATWYRDQSDNEMKVAFARQLEVLEVGID